MKTSSAKAKGRRCAEKVRQGLMAYSPDYLTTDDMIVTPSGVNGPDLWLSTRAKEFWPYTFECKNQESLNVWAALKQSQEHAKCSDLIPLMCFTRNRHDLYIAMRFKHFLRRSGNEHFRNF